MSANHDGHCEANGNDHEAASVCAPSYRRTRWSIADAGGFEGGMRLVRRLPGQPGDPRTEALAVIYSGSPNCCSADQQRPVT